MDDRSQQMLIDALMQGYREGTTPGGVNIASVPGKRADEIAFPGMYNLSAALQGMMGVPLSPNQIVRNDFANLTGTRFDPAFVAKAHK